MKQNDQLFAVFNSVHKIMKAEAVLKNCGVEIQLIPAPRALSMDCGLAISYNGDFYDSVLQLLTTEMILPDFIYLKESNSNYKTIWSLDMSDNLGN